MFSYVLCHVFGVRSASRVLKRPPLLFCLTRFLLGSEFVFFNFFLIFFFKQSYTAKKKKKVVRPISI